MNRRAVPGLVVVVAALLAIIMIGRSAIEPSVPVFAEPEGSWMPSVTNTASLTGTWFCPGVPATGEDGVGGEVVVSNRNSEQIVGRFTVLGGEGVAVERDFTVRGTQSGTGRLYASGSITLGGYYAGVDSFLGLHYSALRIADALAENGFGKKIGPLRSTSQWWKWARNKPI